MCGNWGCEGMELDWVEKRQLGSASCWVGRIRVEKRRGIVVFCTTITYLFVQSQHYHHFQKTTKLLALYLPCIFSCLATTVEFYRCSRKNSIWVRYLSRPSNCDYCKESVVIAEEANASIGAPTSSAFPPLWKFLRGNHLPTDLIWFAMPSCNIPILPI